MLSRFEQLQLAAHFVWSVQVQDTYCDYLSAWHIKQFTQKSSGEGFPQLRPSPVCLTQSSAAAAVNSGGHRGGHLFGQR